MEIHFFFIAMLFFLDSLVGSFRPISPKKRQIRVVAKGVPSDINDANILIPALQLGALSIAVFFINEKVGIVLKKNDEQMEKLESKIDGIDTKLESKINGIVTKFDGIETKFDGIKTKFDGIETKFAALSGEFKMTITVVATVAIVITGLNSVIESSMNINTFIEKQTKGKIFK